MVPTASLPAVNKGVQLPETALLIRISKLIRATNENTGLAGCVGHGKIVHQCLVLVCGNQAIKVEVKPIMLNKVVYVVTKEIFPK